MTELDTESKTILGGAVFLVLAPFWRDLVRWLASLLWKRHEQEQEELRKQAADAAGQLAKIAEEKSVDRDNILKSLQIAVSQLSHDSGSWREMAAASKLTLDEIRIVARTVGIHETQIQVLTTKLSAAEQTLVNIQRRCEQCSEGT